MGGTTGIPGKRRVEEGTAVDPAKELELRGGGRRPLAKGISYHSHVCVLEIYPGNGTEDDEWWRARMEPEDIREEVRRKGRAEAGSQGR